MARLFEYQGKQLLEEVGITVPGGAVAASKEEAMAIAQAQGVPVVLKAQVWSTGRSKAGGVTFASDPAQAAAAAEKLLGSAIKGFPVREVLVERQLAIECEYYAGIIVDDSFRVRAPVVIFSSEGGVDVEEIAARAPQKVARVAVDPLQGFSYPAALDLIRQAGAPKQVHDALAGVLVRLYQLFARYDARSVEINPLVLTQSGELVAADCRISIDDASVQRHPELAIEVARESDSLPSELDKLAWGIEVKDYRGSSFFAEFGQENGGEPRIGFHAIGGGGALLAADTLMRRGMRLANFAETSGNPPASKVYRIARTILAIPDLAGYCLLGPVLASQDQWHHAHGLLKAFREMLPGRPGFPVVIMLAGNKEEETLDLLRRGLGALPVRYAVYGRDYIYRLDQVADQMKAFLDAYLAES